MENKILVNRVSESGLITINLEDFFPKKEIVYFDIKDYLFNEMILREKDFRESLKNLDWSVYHNKIVLIICSVDSIIPLWAYMLISSCLEGIAADVYQGSKEEYLKLHYRMELQKLNKQQFLDQRIVIKGCSHQPVPAEAYANITTILKPYAQNIMFGEPCSTVPIYKRPRILT